MRAVEKVAFIQTLRIIPEELAVIKGSLPKRRNPRVKRQVSQRLLVHAIMAAIDDYAECETAVFALLATFELVSLVSAENGRTFRSIPFIVFFCVTAAYAFGHGLGLSVGYAGGRQQDITLKTISDVKDQTTSNVKEQTISKVRIVMITPHHTIFLMGETTTVVPTSDVLRIVSGPAP